MRNSAPGDAAEAEGVETREWLESLDYVLQHGGPPASAACSTSCGIHAQKNGVKPAVLGQYSLHQHDPANEAGAISRQPGDRTPDQEPDAMERDGDGRPRQPRRRRHWRPHLHLRLGRDAL